MLQPIFSVLLSIALSLLFMGNLSAQRVKVKFGKLSEKDFSITSFPGDPDASAIVLYEHTNIFWDLGNARNVKMVYQVHQRIKILDESAIDKFASQKLGPYYSWRDAESITQIKGYTYNETEEGDIEQIKLSNKSIFIEHPDKRRTTKSFGMPQVKVGSVIEIVYRYSSTNIANVQTHFFQEPVPKLYSEVTLAAPQGVEYSPMFLGDVLPLEQEKSESNISQIKLIAKHFWVSNIPAFKEEAYTNYWGNYVFRVNFSLSAITIPGMFGDYRQTWQKIYKNLIEDEDFEPYLTASNAVDRLWTNIKGTLTEDTPETRLQAILAYLRTEFEWDETLGIYPNESPQSLLQEKEADGASLNMLMIALCRAAGLQAEPVLISTRKHGLAQSIFPNLRQFNHLIAWVGDAENGQLYDVATKVHSYNALPQKDLNGKGFKLVAPEGSWVALSPRNSLMQKTTSRFEMDAEGTMTGTIIATQKEYAADFYRAAFKDSDEEEDVFVAKILADGLVDGGTSAEKIEAADDVNQPLQLKCDIQTRDFTQKAGETIYLQPMMFEQLKENPFKEETRRYPVDYAMSRSALYVMSLQLPEGMEIESLPKATQFALPGGDGSYTYQVQAIGSTLQVMSHMKLNKSVFSPEEYGALRAFYDLIIQKQGEQIVIKRAS